MANLLNKIEHKNTSVHKCCTTKDMAKLIELERLSKNVPWTEAVLLSCLQNNYTCFTLKYYEEIIGFVIFSMTVDECSIVNICVKPDMQCQGHGYNLLQEVLRYAKQHKTNNVFLEVSESNLAAHNLYSKLGFSEIGNRKNYYKTEKGHEDAIIMGLTIQ